jgi:hypothetical protein
MGEKEEEEESAIDWLFDSFGLSFFGVLFGEEGRGTLFKHFCGRCRCAHTHSLSHNMYIYIYVSMYMSSTIWALAENDQTEQTGIINGKPKQKKKGTPRGGSRSRSRSRKSAIGSCIWRMNE